MMLKFRNLVRNLEGIYYYDYDHFDRYQLNQLYFGISSNNRDALSLNSSMDKISTAIYDGIFMIRKTEFDKIKKQILRKIEEGYKNYAISLKEISRRNNTLSDPSYVKTVKYLKQLTLKKFLLMANQIISPQKRRILKIISSPKMLSCKDFKNVALCTSNN